MKGGGESVEGSPACNVRSPDGRSEGRSPQEPRGKCKCPGVAQTRPEDGKDYRARTFRVLKAMEG